MEHILAFYASLKIGFQHDFDYLGVMLPWFLLKGSIVWCMFTYIIMYIFYSRFCIEEIWTYQPNLMLFFQARWSPARLPQLYPESFKRGQPNILHTRNSENTPNLSFSREDKRHQLTAKRKRTRRDRDQQKHWSLLKKFSDFLWNLWEINIFTDYKFILGVFETKTNVFWLRHKNILSYFCLESSSKLTTVSFIVT